MCNWWVVHQVTKSQPLSVGIFFAWNASIGAVSGHGLESGGWFRSPVFALSRLSVLGFSLMASRAFARLPPGFMRVSGRWVVVGHCMDGATEGRATKENGLQAVPGAGCETGRTQPQTAAGHGRLTLLLSAPSSGGITRATDGLVRAPRDSLPGCAGGHHEKARHR